MKINSRATTYNIENKSAYIITLQKMLDIPLSGKLDGRTKERIEQFKNEHRITSDCLVDFRIFEMIKCKKAKCEHTCADDIFPPYLISTFVVETVPPFGFNVARYEFPSKTAVKVIFLAYVLRSIYKFLTGTLESSTNQPLN